MDTEESCARFERDGNVAVVASTTRRAQRAPA
jgi:hypothetical protein